MNQRRALRVLGDDWHDCDKCSHHELRTGSRIVFGAGSSSADYLFIGSHPNFNDEEGAVPYTGDQGDLLFAIAENVGIELDHVYMTYTVGCVPKVIIPETETEEERLEVVYPDKENWEACRPRLAEQIYIIDPRIIVTFGEIPLKALGARDNMGKRPPKMSEAHGKLYDIRIPGRTGALLRYPVMGTLAMDYLIKNPSEAAHGPIASVQEALTRARTYVEWVKEHEVPA